MRNFCGVYDRELDMKHTSQPREARNWRGLDEAEYKGSKDCLDSGVAGLPRAGALFFTHERKRLLRMT